ncbi:MAG TPA: tRNA (adenosine(37)-N6)-dimethylallyltransferase MiaA [Acidimicrobiales bacterium]|nr:tRNA (adenosine(37)-N6)-dimethylallyltransferase MiaA [Acidimicrobiales bacterium]
MRAPEPASGTLIPPDLPEAAQAPPPAALAPVALVGATATGKSQAALKVASTVPGIELVSVDSMAVYRGMDIGTAKPDRAARARVPYHLVDLVDPSEEFTVQQFQAEARRVLAAIAARGHRALLVGGTGLYLRSVVDDLSFPGTYPEVAAALAGSLEASGAEGSPSWRSALEDLHRRLAVLDPVAAGRVDPANRRRLVRALEVTIGSGRPFSSFGPGLNRYPPTEVTQVGLRHDPTDLDRRIAGRFDRLMELGFLEEVRRLAARPGGLSRTARQALGYRELLSHIEEGVPLRTAVDIAVQRTRALARRQSSWFRRDPRIVWMDGDVAGSVAVLLGGFPQAAATVGE